MAKKVTGFSEIAVPAARPNPSRRSVPRSASAGSHHGLLQAVHAAPPRWKRGCDPGLITTYADASFSFS